MTSSILVLDGPVNALHIPHAYTNLIALARHMLRVYRVDSC